MTAEPISGPLPEPQQPERQLEAVPDWLVPPVDR